MKAKAVLTIVILVAVALAASVAASVSPSIHSIDRNITPSWLPMSWGMAFQLR